jgi:hypothetical protein
MDTLALDNKIWKGSTISEIFKLHLSTTLLELHFNLLAPKKVSISLSIGDDGETIKFSCRARWINLKEIEYELYSTVVIDKDVDEVGRLIGNEIIDIKFGVGKTLDTGSRVLYYVKILTDQNNFLFFNNGDQAAYSFDQINEILANDIYGYEWSSDYP